MWFKWPQVASKWPQVGVKLVQVGLKLAQVGLKLTQVGLKLAQVGLKLAQDGLMLPRVGTSWPQVASSWLQVASSWTQDQLREPPGGSPGEPWEGPGRVLGGTWSQEALLEAPDVPKWPPGDSKIYQKSTQLISDLRALASE